MLTSWNAITYCKDGGSGRIGRETGDRIKPSGLGHVIKVEGA